MINEHQEANPWRSYTSLILRVAVFIHMVGWTWALHTRAGSGLGGMALMDWGVPHNTIAFHERLWSLVLLIMATVLLLRPVAAFAFIIGGAVLIDTAGAFNFGGDHFIEWAFGAKALRYGLPFALGVLLLSEKPWASVSSTWMLRIATATVFAVHGHHAIHQHPGFIDLLIGTTRNLTGMHMTEGTTVVLLKVIGAVDIIVAAMVLFKSWTPLLGWLCFWSFITAFSRMTTYGFMSFPELLTRSSHILAPVALYTLHRYQLAKLASEPTAKEASPGAFLFPEKA